LNALLNRVDQNELDSQSSAQEATVTSLSERR